MPIQRIAHSSTEIDVENYIGILRAGQSISDTGWSIYADSAGVNPVDGLGGSPSITWSQNTVSPLSGEVDLRLVKDANDRQGNGVSIPFTIANRHLGKVLQITFDMELFSGTYATGDLRVSIIQDPTGTPVVIEPVNTDIQLGIANQRIRHIASFQTHISITSYRLCIHVSNASTVAYTVDFANFKVWEPTQSVGAVITDWQSYTPTFTQQNGSVLPNITPNTFLWRRVGDSIEILGRFTLTGSLGTYTDINFNLPNGLQFKYLTSSPPVPFQYGTGLFIGGGGSNQPFLTKLDPVSNGRLRIQYQTSSGAIQFAQFTNGTYTGANGDYFTLQTILIPIAGWGSNVAMSSDSNEGRVVAARYNNAVISSTVLNYQNLVYDTHNSYSAGVFTAPISGYYRGSMSLRPTLNLQIYGQINESTVETIYDGYNSGYAETISFQYFLLAGQRLRFTSTGSGFNSQLTNQAFTIERISAGSQVVASVEGVGCRYTSISGQTIGTNTVILFGTRENDTHGAYNSSTGIFTAPMSGWYQIRANVVLNTNTLSFLEIQRDSSTTLVYLSYPSNRGSISTVSYLIGGQTLRIRGTANTSTILSTGSGDNSLDIVRIGI